MSSWILTMKILLISCGIISLAMAMKLAVPVVINFTVYELPTFYSVLLSLFKPPYLYVIINGIIIIIAASTLFTQNETSPSNNDHSQPLISAKTPPPIEFSNDLAVAGPLVEEVPSPQEVAVVYEEEVLEVKQPVVVNGLEVVENEEQVVENEEEVVVSRSTYTPPQKIISKDTETVMETVTPVTERPLVMSRFGHRKPLKASPEGGRALRVARPRRQEALETTWRIITEGRHVPLTRHLKKSDTFENHGRHADGTAADENCSSPQNQRMQKLETFKDRTNNYHDSPVSSVKISREPSLTRDELNRRVEAFIKNFNEEMRLQREDSLKQYMEMINRGAE